MDKVKFVLYISTNDGSDTRINKEVKTLSQHYQVIFLGVGDDQHFFLKDYCRLWYIVNGKRNSVGTILRQFVFVLKTILKRRDISIHVVNEQLSVFFYPLLFFRHTVLDVFDSIFLRQGLDREKWSFIKWLVYLPMDRIIVTDDNRKQLMPTFTQSKLSIIPNYPFRYETPILPSKKSDNISILFFGWLGMARGGKQAKELLEASEKIKIIMLGWFSDEACKALTEHPRVDYRGVLPQNEALKIAEQEADYILCLYEPKNLNTINASPNKIYDSIQTSTPVIINSEVKVSALVTELNTGIVIKDYFQPLDAGFVSLLEKKKGTFAFSEHLKETYTWEHVEPQLVALHRR